MQSSKLGTVQPTLRVSQSVFTYVANHVPFIRQESNQSQWKYVH